MLRMRDRTCLTSGLTFTAYLVSCSGKYQHFTHFLKGRLNVVFVNGLSFMAFRSLAMQMMGIYEGINQGDRFEKASQVTLVFLIKALRAPTPPLSPPDIPSTSSMMRHDLSVMAIPAAFVAFHI